MITKPPRSRHGLSAGTALLRVDSRRLAAPCISASAEATETTRVDVTDVRLKTEHALEANEYGCLEAHAL